MKNTNLHYDPEFRNLSAFEEFEIRGGLCVFPTLLGQKAAQWLMDHFWNEES